MKTIIARFEDMKKDPAALIDGASANKVEAALATIGIALRDAAGEFRPLQDVFDELGMKWNTLTRNQQAYIATVAAGSRQQSRFLALMNNYDRTLDLVAESQNSAGAAAEQYATYQDSAAAATARLTAAWEEFYTKIVNSEQIIWVLDRLKDLVEVMTKVGPVVSAIGASIGALGLQTLIKGVLPKVVDEVIAAAAVGEAANFSLLGLAKGTGAIILSFGKLIAIIGAVIAVVYLAVEAFKVLDKAFHKDREEAKQLFKDIGELNQAVGKSTEKADSLEKLMDRYDELSKKVYRTKEEQEELNKVIEDIAKSSDRAVTAIKENGDAHLYNAESIRAEIEEERRLAEYNANRSFNKTQRLFELTGKSNSEVTPEMWREAGFSEYADYLEDYNDAQINPYKIWKEFNDNPFKNANLEYWIGQGLSTEQAKLQAYNLALNGTIANLGEVDEGVIGDYLERRFSNIDFQGYDLGNIKTFEQLINFISKSDISEFKDMDPLELYKEISKMIGDILYSTYNESYQKAIDIITSEDKSEEVLLKEYNRTLRTEIFKPLSTFNDAAKAFNELMLDGLEFSVDQMDEVQEGYEKFYEENKEAIDEYLKSDKTEADVGKLLEAIGNDQSAITSGLIKYAENIEERITEQAIERRNQRSQFLTDLMKNDTTQYYKIFGGIEGLNATEFLNNDKITSKDLDYLTTFVKLELDIESERTLFKELTTDEEDAFQTLAEKYVNSMSNGFTNETLELQQQLVDMLTKWEIPEEDIQKLIEDFYPTYRELLEEKIDEDFSTYNTTRKGASGLGKLKGKQRTQFFEDNIDASRYLEYTEDGEEYLNVLGQIVLVEQQRSRLQRELQLEINGNTSKINEQQTEIDKIIEKGEEATEEELARLKTLESENDRLREANNLYNKQLDYIKESATVQQYESIALQANVDKAQETADNITLIAEAWAEYQQGTEDSNLKAISSLNQLDASYQQLFMDVDAAGNEVLKLDQNIVDQMVAGETAKYEAWRENEIKTLEGEKEVLLARADALEEWIKTGEWNYNQDAENKENAAQIGAEAQVSAENKGFQTGIVNASNYYNKLGEIAKNYFDQVTDWAKVVYENISNPDQITLEEFKKSDLELEIETTLSFEDFSKNTKWDDVNIEAAQRLADQYRQRAAIIDASIAKLGDLSPQFQKTYDKAIKDATKSGGKALKEIGKIIDDTLKAIEDLDKLLIDIRKNLRDIDIDYNPFIDLFEAWEKEWDYYYNIKRLIAQIGTQGQYIDNIISSDYATASQRLAAQQAKIGNLLAAMSANDTYIEALRAGMSQTAVELMEEFGEYYRVNPDSGQIYQHDTSLQEINDLINLRKQEVYQVQKLQNEKQNDLALENARLEALEEEKSAYEEILSTVEDQIEDLKNNEDITADISELKNVQAELKAKIIVSDDSIEEVKDRIKVIENEIEDIELDLTLKEDSLDKLEDYVSKMEDKVSEYEEYWENLNSTIAEQQELLESLTEIYQDYVNTAISTEQSLYNAIIENYQDEIDEKKKQYDYLKQLDKEYLDSVKDNISKEKQARKDSENQRNYQQSLQRAQLLQMDTSGAYRSELASLNKEIEKQRQDLYDDLVDKQVKALEEEINKRHELYDMEVAALEERLAYMQENAILLWEMVNEIIAQGTENMMATLENTTDYINANELSKMNQRKEWEYNVLKTFDGVKNGTIDMLNELIKAGNDFIVDKYPEVGRSLDEYSEVFRDASRVVNEYSDQLGISTLTLNNNTRNGTEMFERILQDFAEQWNYTTNLLTGYSNNWKNVTNSLKNQLEENITALKAMNNDGGSIKELDNTLRQAAKEMYQSFIEERNRYKDELNTLIKKIQTDISAAIQYASDAIRKAVDSIKAGNGSSSSGGSSGGGGNTSGGSSGSVGAASGNKGGIEEGQYKGYTMSWKPSENAAVQTYSVIKGKNLTREQLWDMFLKDQEEMRKRAPKAQFWGFTPFIRGGLADFTGPAWLDGTSSNPERVLSPKQTKLFESMVSSLERASNNSDINSALGSSYNIGDINTTIQVDRLDDQTDINRLAKQVEDRIMRTIRNRVTVSVNKGV